MTKYYRVMEKLFAVYDTVDWMQSIPLARLDVSDELYEYKELNKLAAATAIQKLVIPMSQQSSFGAIVNESLLLFRGDTWLNDDSLTFIGNAVPKMGLTSSNVVGISLHFDGSH